MGRSRVKSIRRQTANRFLNLYEAEVIHRDGSASPYFIASRAESEEALKMNTGKDTPDGVAIFSLHGASRDRVVLIRQFRYPINNYIYEFPAGLTEPGESMEECAVREMYEETGLAFSPVRVAEAFTKPYFTTVGMTDECCGMIYGYCDGTPTSAHEEAGEDIEVILADRQECRRILKEERVAMNCAFMLMQFIRSEGEDAFGFLRSIEA